MGRVHNIRDGSDTDFPDFPAPTSETAVAADRPKGTSFPTSPAVNDLFYRTDLKREFQWNGANWLSTDTIEIQLGVQGGTGASADGNHGRASVPYKGVHNLWIEAVDFSSFLSVAAQWSININYVTAANASVLIVTRSCNSDAGATWVTERKTVGAQLNAAAMTFELWFDEVTGTSTFFANATIIARIIG